MSISSQKISLVEIDSICASLGVAMETLMDQNAVALIVGSTGEITFTKQGTKVISEASHGHPIEKLIVNTCNKYHVETGEDCKMLLLLLREIMHGVKEMLKRYDDTYVRKTLSLEVISLVSLTPHLFESVRSMAAVISNPSDCCFKFFCDDLKEIIRTFIGLRFPRHISEDFTELVYRFLVDSISDWSDVRDALQYLISRFDLFCSKVLSPLHKSSILRGLLLHQRFASRTTLESSSCNLQFVVVWDVSQKSSDEVCWSVGVDSIPSQLRNLWKHVGQSLTNLRHQEVSVILTPSVACENFQSLCSQCEITLIDNIPSEDVSNIVFFTAVVPINYINETVEPENVASVRSIKSVSFHNCHYTHLEVVVGVGNSIAPNHVVLCALTDSLWKEYYTEFYNCLKVVKHWLDPSINIFYRKQFGTDDNTVRNNNHRETGYDFLQRLNLRSKTSCTICPDDCVRESCDLGFSFPLGLWEFVFRNSLSASKTLFPNLCNILDNALLQTVCKVWNIPLRDFKGQESFYDFYQKARGNKKGNPIVPVLSKENQFLEVLQLLQQLLKIDAILCSK